MKDATRHILTPLLESDETISPDQIEKVMAVLDGKTSDLAKAHGPRTLPHPPRGRQAAGRQPVQPLAVGRAGPRDGRPQAVQDVRGGSLPRQRCDEAEGAGTQGAVGMETGSLSLDIESARLDGSFGTVVCLSAVARVEPPTVRT